MPNSTLSREKNEQYSSKQAVTLTVVRPAIRGAAHISESGSAHAGNHYSLRIPSAPATFRFARQHGGSGLKFLGFSGLALATAGFLGLEFNAAPSLHVQIIVVTAVCVLFGLALAHLAVRNLLGKVRVDSRGIRLSPRYLGYTIPWNELRSWEADVFSFRFVVPNASFAHTLDRELLSVEDQLELLAILTSCAPEKEVGRVTD